ncbi:UNVERIFIED_CONTAM: hypothetical protein RMT77_019416 [Armadillidium vulgare]
MRVYVCLLVVCFLALYIVESEGGNSGQSSGESLGESSGESSRQNSGENSGQNSTGKLPYNDDNDYLRHQYK